MNAAYQLPTAAVAFAAAKAHHRELGAIRPTPLLPTVVAPRPTAAPKVGPVSLACPLHLLLTKVRESKAA